MVSINAHHIGLTYTMRSFRGALGGRSAAAASDSRLSSKGKRKLVAALKDVSLNLNIGDRLGLIGRNGSGKTTLLKVLYGIYPPTSGTLSIEGKVDALFNVNLGFRKEATGRRNIELRGLMNGWSPEAIAARMEAIIEFSELGDFIDLPLQTYSQGMTARLAFSIATTMEPEILLMDEWLGAGDPEFQQKAKQRMMELTEKARIIVLASHNYALLRNSCNKILKLEGGEVKAFYPTIQDFTD
jgi:ABC-type polysaccharide/polyol phosphate transport system ATPase subunit